MGKLYVIATPIGNLKDITLRALETLKECDILAVEDTRHTLKLLNYYNIKKKMISYHKYNEKERIKILMKFLIEEDMKVGLVSNAGTPCISDPGYVIVKEARERGIEVISVCGPSAITSALSVSGLPSDHFLFYGFLPKKEKDREKVLEEIKEKKIETFILFESPKRIISLARSIYKIFPSSKVCFCNDLTKIHEKIYYGPIKIVLEQLENNPFSHLGEYTVIVYNEYERENKEVIIEALIVETMIKNNLDLKSAMEYVSKKYKISKKEVYNKVLNIKSLFKE
ncbi:MAG: 16S rRNA (cytidine(1402)-2'-O)-methyltransferase [Dictyoglomus sp.]|nr:16S rRNA (cytidine(1402)-2'-O)-methyltransferase [Dictyoglomus sp.]MDW8188793.1 16S rRNA (cytidine(1402)-2'-O)-methyltransferase [Dictyoglomus sp.]